MLNEFISLISHLGATARVCVGISVSPNIGIEMIEINSNTSTITKYTNRPLEFDYAKREIIDFDLFKEAVAEMFEELGISLKSNVVLNLPNIYFGLTTLPANIPTEATTNAVISSAEQSYIFKRAEPAVNWINLSKENEENQKIAFCAIQQTMLIEITEVFKSLGCNLIAIETSVASMLKALNYTGISYEQVKSGQTWNLITVNSVSYSITTINNKTIVDYYEEPLALKSFVGDDIYNAIVTSVNTNLTPNSSQNCIIISETDLVSAEVLSMKLPQQFNYSFVECNKYSESEILQTELTVLPTLAPKITLQAIGAGIYNFSDYPIKFNLLGQDLSGSFSTDNVPKIQFRNTEIELNPVFLKVLAGILGVILILPVLLGMLIFNQLNNMQQETFSTLKTELDKQKIELKKYEKLRTESIFNESTEINLGMALNKEKILEYSFLGINLPKKLWLTSLKIKQGLTIKGGSKDIESIYEFYRNLRLATSNQELKIHKLSLASDDENVTPENLNTETASFYTFEITDLKDVEEKETEDSKDVADKDNKNKKRKPNKR